MIAPFYTHLCPFFIFCIKKDPVQRTGGSLSKSYGMQFRGRAAGDE